MVGTEIINKMEGQSILRKIIFAGVLVFIFFTVWQSTRINGPSDISVVTIAGQDIKVDTVTTPESRAQGLSGRGVLAEDEGMLFVFEKPGQYNFWMKDMNFAIDMIWIGEDMRVIYIKKDARPEDFLSTFGPDKDAKYVLEVNSGFSDKYNLVAGDLVEFSKQ